MYIRNRNQKLTSLFILLITVFISSVVITISQPSKSIWKSQSTSVDEVSLPSAEGSRVKSFSEIILGKSSLELGNLILVRSDSPFHRDLQDEVLRMADYQNSCYLLDREDISLARVCLEHFNAWTKAFYLATGIQNIIVNSAYRSVERQQEIYDERVLEYGVETAEQFVALPARSEHHTGLAVDIAVFENGDTVSYSASGDYAWFLQNAPQYGFVQRYQEDKVELTEISNEPWHFRYVGKPHALLMEQLDFCLEEYIAYLRSFPYDKQHLFVTDSDYNFYEIYFVPCTGEETAVPVPTGHPYEISGNNVDGFIITVSLS